MSEPVKRRGYDNSRRAAAARDTRRTVVDAARTLFLADGYPATTLAGIARAARVSVQTVYAQFGSKRQVLKEVIDQTVAGDDEPVPIAERPFVAALRADPDPRGKIRSQAAIARRINERTWPVDRMTRSAAEVDPEVAELWRRGADQRRRGMGMFADHLEAAGELRPGLSPTAAGDRLAALIDPELYRLTVLDRGWPPAQYEEWLADLMVASLLPAARNGS